MGDPIAFYYIEKIKVKLYIVNKDGRCGAIDIAGRLRIDTSFADLGEYSEDRMAFSYDERMYGFINGMGRVVIPPILHGLPCSFKEGFAVFGTDGALGFITRSGDMLMSARLYSAGAFSEGLARVQETATSSYGYIDKNGTYAIQPSFFSADHFSEGLAAVRNNDLKGGYIDHHGRFQVKPQFTMAYRFSEGLAAVSLKKHGGDIGFINAQGEIVIPHRWQGADVHFSEGLAQIADKKGRFGFINPLGELVVECKFYNVDHFSNGLCVACMKPGKRLRFGYIEKTGKWVIPPEYDYAWDFDENGIAVVRVRGDETRYINRMGEYLWPEWFPSPDPAPLGHKRQRGTESK